MHGIHCKDRKCMLVNDLDPISNAILFLQKFQRVNSLHMFLSGSVMKDTPR